MGVVEIPYVEKETVKEMKGRVKGSRKAHRVKFKVTNTGAVAEILEAKYGIMQAFYAKHEADIASAMEGALQGSLENILTGAPIPRNPLIAAESEIEGMFKRFLSLSEIEHMGVPGVPTEAALNGVNHRLKRGKGPRRPSFIDTGLYQAAFAVEIE